MGRTPEQIIGRDLVAQLAFEGFAVVPQEPTPRMIEAAWQTIVNVPTDDRMNVLLMNGRTAHGVKMLNRYRSMLAAFDDECSRPTPGSKEKS